MMGKPAARAAAVDRGDPPLDLRALLRALAPTPGRLGNTTRLVAVVLLLVTLCEVFRVPEPSIACFIALLISQDNAASTVLTASITGVFGVLGILAVVLGMMATLSQPALRIPIIAFATFGTMFLSQALTMGAPVFLAGFLLAYGLTNGDMVAFYGLQPGSNANTPEFSLPELAFMPAEEALLHSLLWLLLTIAMPVVCVIVVHVLTGRDPATLLRDGLAARLDAAAHASDGDARALKQLERFAREGSTALQGLAGQAAKYHTVTPRLHSDTALIGPIERLVLVVLVWSRHGDPADPEAATLRHAGRDAAALRTAILGNGSSAARIAHGGGSAPADPVLRPLAVELAAALEEADDAFAARTRAVPSRSAEAEKGLMKPDAFSNPDYPRFAFKVTLGAMICYLTYTGADWPQIHTAMITCFFVSLGTIGETIHKATLRIVGCLFGATLAIGTILLLMPSMTDLGDLLIPVGVVTFIGGWVIYGGPRIGYAGVQAAFAYVLVVLQGFGPTLDMQTGRDRVIGIVFGNIVASTIAVWIWPINIAATVRRALSEAVEKLADATASVGGEADLRPFAVAVTSARGLVANNFYEPRGTPRKKGSRPIDAGLLADVQALVVPFAVVLRLAATELTSLPAEARQRIEAYHHALAEWLRTSACWIQTGEGAEGVVAARPAPPVLTQPEAASEAAWYRLLDRDLAAILVRAVPPAEPDGRTVQDPALARG